MASPLLGRPFLGRPFLRSFLLDGRFLGFWLFLVPVPGLTRLRPEADAVKVQVVLHLHQVRQGEQNGALYTVQTCGKVHFKPSSLTSLWNC